MINNDVPIPVDQDPGTDNERDDDDLVRRRREFESYTHSKAREIDEQRWAWRYYHVDQWTPHQLRTLRRRGQPHITFDRTGRKIDSIGGTIRRLRTDPKCYPNTPNGEQGAEVATQVIRTICDASMAEDIEVECVRDALIHGIGVDELVLTTGDKGDPDLRFEHRDPRTWFYDPRSQRNNFEDARFHGIYKWADIDELDELVPGASDKVAYTNDNGFWTAFDVDREVMWVDTRHRVRLVDHWYRVGGKWQWTLHTGSVVLMQGDSPFTNERGMSISKFNAFANMIDVDGDHYGFVRRLRGPQDAINQHRSKAMHIMNTRQLKIREGAVDDVEITRREAARPDGTLVYRGDKNDLEILQPDQEFLQQTNYYNDAKTEIDGFGPNQQLIQNFGQNVSGRAANLLQQAGLAELGPFLKNYRMWKLERYRKAWNGAQKYWTSDRMIRVTNDTGIAQFLQVNTVDIDPWGRPILVNLLGAIDVEIKVDEGPDNETVMGDVFDLLMALSQNNVPVPPQAIIEASALPLSEKKKLQAMVNQPDPVKQAATQAAVAKVQSEAQLNTAKAGAEQTKGMLNVAKARTEGIPQSPEPPPSPLDVAQKLADINETNATAAHKRASANTLDHKALLSPLQMLADHAQQNADRTVDHFHKSADRAAENFHKNADRVQQAQQAMNAPVPE